MTKVMNVVFGIGIAVILFIVVMLGTQVFCKEPTWEDFNCTSPQPIYTAMELCPDNITVLQCREMVNSKPVMNNLTQAEFDRCNEEYRNSSNEYGKKLFIINNLAGVIAVIVSLFLFSMINIAAGTAFSGLALIVYGFIRGWQGTGDVPKFIVALIVATLFVTFAVVVNRRYSGKA
jgi:uncharacterized protein (DUF983 family)